MLIPCFNFHCTTVHVQGAAVGTVSGIAFTFWVAIGAIITEVPAQTQTLTLLTSECGTTEEMFEDMWMNGTTSLDFTQTSSADSGSDESSEFSE